MTMSDCIIPNRKIGWQGYMMMRFKGKYQSPHRVAWQVLNGDIPVGIIIDHNCHNEALLAGQCKGGNNCQHRACINIEHLRAITQAENTKAGARVMANNTHCKHGHSIESNLAKRPNGRSFCVACRQVSNLASNLRQKAVRN